MRYVGQGYEIEVPLNRDNLQNGNIKDIQIEFEKVYKVLFGRTEKMPLEIISWRTIASGPVSKFIIKDKKFNTSKNIHPKKRQVYFGGKTYLNTDVINRNNLSKSFQSKGPLVIEERESTLIIPPNFIVNMDPTGNLLIKRAK
jgi:N-methylhydantoinase A